MFGYSPRLSESVSLRLSVCVSQSASASVYLPAFLPACLPACLPPALSLCPCRGLSLCPSFHLAVRMSCCDRRMRHVRHTGRLAGSESDGHAVDAPCPFSAHAASAVSVILANRRVRHLPCARFHFFDPLQASPGYVDVAGALRQWVGELGALVPVLDLANHAGARDASAHFAVRLSKVRWSVGGWVSGWVGGMPGWLAGMMVGLVGELVGWLLA